ncbi:PREDICTED: uncharacterized protein LOC18586329 [Theobroma cacao]|uniref:Uncharacterized protein LOC18586329 n=1 Tax=Theobroma cacao TaxID=3641 RepID=A0AB32ULW7_THECC|nr:PREDICTED: uncharacterized protein LOC18586329 [Theobroma cacao]
MVASSSSASWETQMVSQEQINAFHTIDRNIFARLVLNLRRDLGESIHVMAFLLWVEHVDNPARNLVFNIQPWSDTLINALAKEAVLCLNCIKSDEFPYNNFKDSNYLIPLIQGLTKNWASLRFFHHNRLRIIPGIIQNIQDVCFRAFRDIFKLASTINSMDAQRRSEQSLELSRFYGPLTRPTLPVFNDYNSGVGNFSDQNMGNKQVFWPNWNSENSSFSQQVYHHNIKTQIQSLDEEMEELLNNTHSICTKGLEENNNNNNQEVPAEDRTIFLTFSKGYSLSEKDVTDFFARKFGDDFIERVEMQEVLRGEQPLFAKLVLHSASGLATILNGVRKAKYSIKGKHVWARKFEHRYPQVTSPSHHS